MRVCLHGVQLSRNSTEAHRRTQLHRRYIHTYLTRDHLDYHKTFENYRDAKKAFFDGLPKTAFAITNADDKNGMVMVVQNTKAKVKTYSVRSMADFKAKILECHFGGMYLEIDGREVGVQFIGKFNVSNLLAVYGAAVMLGQSPENILIAMSTLKSVSGRLDPVHSPLGYTAIVDYAHCIPSIPPLTSSMKQGYGYGTALLALAHLRSTSRKVVHLVDWGIPSATRTRERVSPSQRAKPALFRFKAFKRAVPESRECYRGSS